MIGMAPMYPYVYANNNIQESDPPYYAVKFGPIEYLPPAPSILSYSVSGSYGDETISVSFIGDQVKNTQSYSQSHLVRTIRYKVNGGDWTYIDTDTIVALTFETTFNVVLHPGDRIVVEGWMAYRGVKSEVSTFSFTNTNKIQYLYGSRDSVSKKIVKFYGSKNNVTKRVNYFYGSINGVTKKVFEDV